MPLKNEISLLLAFANVRIQIASKKPSFPLMDPNMTSMMKMERPMIRMMKMTYRKNGTIFVLTDLALFRVYVVLIMIGYRVTES